MCLATNSTSASTYSSLTQHVLNYEEWTKRREGPPPILPPRCLSAAISAKYAGGKYSDGFGDDGISIPCMVTLAYLTRQPSNDPEVYTCALPTGKEMRERDQSDDVKKAKQAAVRVESAKAEGNAPAVQSAVTELRQVTDKMMTRCLQA